MVEERYRNTGVRVSILLVCLLLALTYVGGVLFSQLGPLPYPELWLLLSAGIPLAIVFVGPEGKWSERTVLTLFAIASAASIITAIHAGSVRDVVIPPDHSIYYFGFEYVWDTNTLRYGLTRSGESYPGIAHPNRPHLLIATIAMALGLFGRIPEKWTSEPSRRQEREKSNEI